MDPRGCPAWCPGHSHGPAPQPRSLGPGPSARRALLTCAPSSSWHALPNVWMLKSCLAFKVNHRCPHPFCKFPPDSEATFCHFSEPGSGRQAWVSGGRVELRFGRAAGRAWHRYTPPAPALAQAHGAPGPSRASKCWELSAECASGCGVVPLPCVPCQPVFVFRSGSSEQSSKSRGPPSLVAAASPGQVWDGAPALSLPVRGNPPAAGAWGPSAGGQQGARGQLRASAAGTAALGAAGAESSPFRGRAGPRRHQLSLTSQPPAAPKASTPRPPCTCTAHACSTCARAEGRPYRVLRACACLSEAVGGGVLLWCPLALTVLLYPLPLQYEYSFRTEQSAAARLPPSPTRCQQIPQS